jgi:hypothetical protein
LTMHLEISAIKDGREIATAFLTDPSDEEVTAAIGKLTAELKMWTTEPLWPIQWDVRIVEAPSLRIPPT